MTLSPICILSVLGRIRSSVWFGSLYCIFVSWLVGVVVVIYVSCGLYCNPVVMLPLVLIPLASRVWFVAHVVSEGVSESISCGFRRDRWNPHGTGSGASQVGIRASGWRYPTSPACRITLPTGVVVSSVKTYFLKIRWIVLISSDFSPYLYSFSAYLCEFWVFSFIRVFWVLGLYAGWTIFAPQL